MIARGANGWVVGVVCKPCFLLQLYLTITSVGVEHQQQEPNMGEGELLMDLWTVDCVLDFLFYA